MITINNAHDLLLVRMESSEADPIPAKAIKCDRICRTDCQTKVEASFIVETEGTGKYKGLSDVPERDCYNWYDDEMSYCQEDDEDEICCRTKLRQAETHQVKYCLRTIIKLICLV